MRPLKLHSCLAAQIENFINLRRLSGTDYQSQAQLLGYFDRFVFEQEHCEPRITCTSARKNGQKKVLIPPHLPVELSDSP